MSVTDCKAVGPDCSQPGRAAAAFQGQAASGKKSKFCTGDDRYMGDPRYRFLAVLTGPWVRSGQGRTRDGDRRG
jgi:hypothetical protein